MGLMYFFRWRHRVRNLKGFCAVSLKVAVRQGANLKRHSALDPSRREQYASRISAEPVAVRVRPWQCFTRRLVELVVRGEGEVVCPSWSVGVRSPILITDHTRRSLWRSCRHLCSRCLAHRRTPSLCPYTFTRCCTRECSVSRGRSATRALRKILERQVETPGLLDRPVFGRKPL